MSVQGVADLIYRSVFRILELALAVESVCEGQLRALMKPGKV